jgi:hypothetical protein
VTGEAHPGTRAAAGGSCLGTGFPWLQCDRTKDRTGRRTGVRTGSTAGQGIGAVLSLLLAEPHDRHPPAWAVSVTEHQLPGRTNLAGTTERTSPLAAVGSTCRSGESAAVCTRCAGSGPS